MMATPIEPAAKRPSRRRWFQFSLRSLLLLTLIASLALGWVASERRKAKQQRQAIEALEKLCERIESVL